MFDYRERRRRLGERMEAEDVDVLFLSPSADLEYLTGVERQIPNFGEASYAHGWVTGAFFRSFRSCFSSRFSLSSRSRFILLIVVRLAVDTRNVLSSVRCRRERRCARPP